MRPFNLVPALAGIATLLASCGKPPAGDRSALAAVTSAVMGVPITTSSDAARNHFLQGQRELDLGRFIEANVHFVVSVYAGDPQAAIDELNQLVAAIDGMDVPDPRGVKTGALMNAAIIAIHSRNFPAAERALKQRSGLMMQEAAAVGTPAFRRAQQANIVYFDAWLAARKGDYATARRLTDRVAALVRPDANPRKMEPVHELKGFVALYQGNYGEAAGHFTQGNLLDIYIKYQLALAQEGAGNSAEAKQLFREVANNNFNNIGFGLVRKEASQKAG
ncbi:MAG: tetratricopeptide repeat protein [Gemmatimonadales bacterium]